MKVGDVVRITAAREYKYPLNWRRRHFRLISRKDWAETGWKIEPHRPSRNLMTPGLNWVYESDIVLVPLYQSSVMKAIRGEV